MEAVVKITVKQKETQEVLWVSCGENLRAALLKRGRSPYRGCFRQLNCKGMGLCGSCKVRVREGKDLWERRSCQIQCFQEMEIELE
jgi:ferredoxin